MKQVYPKVVPLAKSGGEDGLAQLEELCRRKVSELIQACLESEVDELRQRLRGDASQGPIYRNGHDPERSVTTSAGAIRIRRPRLRGLTYESALLPKHVRRLPSLDRTFHKLWVEGV